MELQSVTILLLLLTAWHRQLQALPLDAAAQPQLEFDFILEITRHIHEVYNVECYVFYITQRLRLEAFEDFFQKFCFEYPLVPVIILYGSDGGDAFPMDGFLNTAAVCFIFTTDVDDPTMKFAARSMKGVRELKTIFVLMPFLHNPGYWHDRRSYNKFTAMIRAIYDFIWKMQFQNTILLTLGNNVYVGDPYPVKQIKNLTNRWHIEDFFISYRTDFKGYVVDTPVMYDLPRVFVLTSNESKNMDQRKLKVSGTSALIFQEFLRTINVTFQDSRKSFDIDKQTFSFDYILSRVEDRSIEMSPHSNTYIRQSFAGSSYPIGIIDWCIMVPFLNRSPDHLYLQRTFEYSTWILLLFASVYIAVSIWLCTPSRSRDVSTSFLASICSIICIVPISVLLSRTRRMRYVFVVLFIVGFLTSNMFVCKLASFLTSSPDRAQINTVHDIVNADLKVMILDYEFEYLQTLSDCTEEFIKQIIVVDKYTLNLHRDVLNTSFGYSVTTDRWNFLSKQQRLLRKPIFRLSRVCMGPFYHAFPMQRDSPFYLLLKYFLMKVARSGLNRFWEERTFADALRLKYARKLQLEELMLPLSFSFFHAVWIILFCGLLLAGIMFVFELI